MVASLQITTVAVKRAPGQNPETAGNLELQSSNGKEFDSCQQSGQQHLKNGPEMQARGPRLRFRES
jgi:hypothetical protein